MQVFSRLRERRYCAFCKTSRRIYGKKHINLTNVLLALLFALVSIFVFYGEAAPEGLGLFCLYLISSEIFIYFRWRMNIVCGLCGFDPVVYKKSPARAAEKVREFFHEQIENPEFQLTQSPLLQVQKRIRENEKKKLEIEHLLHRTKSSSLAHNKSL